MAIMMRETFSLLSFKTCNNCRLRIPANYMDDRLLVPPLVPNIWRVSDDRLRAKPMQIKYLLLIHTQVKKHSSRA